LLNIGGKTSARGFLRVLNALKIPAVLLVDKDAEDPTSKESNRPSTLVREGIIPPTQAFVLPFGEFENSFEPQVVREAVNSLYGTPSLFATEEDIHSAFGAGGKFSEELKKLVGQKLRKGLKKPELAVELVETTLAHGTPMEPTLVATLSKVAELALRD
jgi:hypothetical protein